MKKTSGQFGGKSRSNKSPKNLAERIRCGREPAPSTPALLKTWCFEFYLVTLGSMSDDKHDATGTARRAWSQMAAIYDGSGGSMPPLEMERPPKCTVEEAKAKLRRIIDWCDIAIRKEQADKDQAAYSRMAGKVVGVFSAAIELADLLEHLRINPVRAAEAWRPSADARRRFTEGLEGIGKIKDKIPPEVLIELTSLANVAADLPKKCISIPDVCLFLAGSDLRGPATRGWQALTAANPKFANQFQWASPPTAGTAPVAPEPANSNGPVEPSNFVWEGVSRGLPPISWRLIKFLWKLDRRTATVDDTFDAVWGHDSSRSSSALKSAISRLNNQFLVASIPITICQKAGYVTVSIPDSASSRGC